MRDDGQGMAMARIRQIAAARGLVEASTRLSDEETAQLIEFIVGLAIGAALVGALPGGARASRTRA